MREFHRRNNRLPAPSYSGRGLYFLTLCLEKRIPRFTDSRLVSLCLDVLRQACVNHSFQVYGYCFMPDHLHLVLVALDQSSSLPVLVKTFKGRTATLGRALEIRGLWQKGYFDHVIRDGTELDSVARYVFENPVRAGLVRDPFDWSHSGSWMMDWKKVGPTPVAFRPPWKKQPLV